jgi:alpha-tubulin suppressor-like RCC1 family protein
MSALDVLRQIKQARRAGNNEKDKKVVEWGNADYINEIGVENLPRRELKNHLEARDLDVNGTRLELIDRLRSSLADEQLHKFAYTEAIDTEMLIQADLEERGSVYVCGINNKGQLGMGDMESRNFFGCIPQLRGAGIIKVIAKNDLSYALSAEYDVFVWGGGGVGRTGLNPRDGNKGNEAKLFNYLEPIIVTDLAGEECVSIGVGGSHALACGKGGDCFVWGDGDSGQLGLGSLEHHHTVAVNNSFPPVADIGCGSNHSVVLTKEGGVYTWGHSINGRLGIGASERLGAKENERHYFPIPSNITALEFIREISCGTDHTLAIGPSGVWSWGNGSGGRLGLGDNNDRYDPCLVPRVKGKTILGIAAGVWHSSAIVSYPPMQDGGWLYTWGSGYHGQLGRGLEIVCPKAEVVEYFKDHHLLIKYVAAGSHHCAALTTEGELYTWGSNANGQLGRKIDEKDVNYTGIPGHVGGFGAIVGKVGRGFPRSVSCGSEFTLVATYPYEGPDFATASSLMEEAKIREQEALLEKRRQAAQK